MFRHLYIPGHCWSACNHLHLALPHLAGTCACTNVINKKFSSILQMQNCTCFQKRLKGRCTEKTSSSQCMSCSCLYSCWDKSSWNRNCGYEGIWEGVTGDKDGKNFRIWCIWGMNFVLVQKEGGFTHSGPLGEVYYIVFFPKLPSVGHFVWIAVLAEMLLRKRPRT